jgi:hypothetical protein
MCSSPIRPYPVPTVLSDRRQALGQICDRWPGYGVHGQTDHGVGVFGESNSAHTIAVAAQNDNGIALLVSGKATFSSSGTAKVAGTKTKAASSVT